MRFLLSIIFILFFIRFEIVIFIFEIYFPAPFRIRISCLRSRLVHIAWYKKAATRDYHYSAAYVPIPLVKIIIALQPCYRSSTIFDLLDITDLRSCYAHSLHVTKPETFVCIVEGLSFGSLIYLSAPYLPLLLERSKLPHSHPLPSQFPLIGYTPFRLPIWPLTNTHYLHLATDNLLDRLSLWTAPAVGTPFPMRAQIGLKLASRHIASYLVNLL